MELTANHRAQLLDSLEDAHLEVERLSGILEANRQRDRSDEIIMLQERTEIDHYLALARIDTIKLALIDNDIGY